LLADTSFTGRRLRRGRLGKRSQPRRRRRRRRGRRISSASVGCPRVDAERQRRGKESSRRARAKGGEGERVLGSMGFMMHVPICASHTRTAGGTPILNPLARFPGGLSLVLPADATRRTCSPVQARQDREAVRHVARPGRQDTGACGSAVILASLPSRAPLPRVAAAAHSAGGDGASRMTQYSDTKVQAPRL